MATHYLIAMATPNADDVRNAFNHLNTVEIEDSDLCNGLRIAVDESEAGLFFQQVRERGFNAESKRIGDTLVSHIEATKGLGQLFG
jgi:hypothetical protein